MYPHLQVGGHTDFGVDPVGVGIGVILCLHIPCEPVVGFLPNVHGYIIGT